MRNLPAGILIALLVTGCAKDTNSPESALSPAGPSAQYVQSLTWLFLAVCAVVYVGVFLFLVGALVHRRHGKAMEPSNDPLTPEPAGEKRTWRVVLGALAVTIVTLFVLLGADFATGRAIHHLGDDPQPIRIRLIGHQWWWEATYDDWPDRYGPRGPSFAVTTANELHIPVDGEHPATIQLDLDSHDVIHSFWVPNLAGKRDLIPGHPTSIYVRATKPGIYWGECAEYCGYQHANMRLAVIAEPPDQFKKWLAAQLSSAPKPTTDMEKRGRDVFLHSTCVMCHAISGTGAYGLVGPNLTHFSSRQTIGAGAAPNTAGYLAGWIVNPQSLKPGCGMPQNSFDPMDLRALLEYLQTLE